MENMKLGSIAPGTNRQLAGPEPGSWGVMLGLPHQCLYLTGGFPNNPWRGHNGFRVHECRIWGVEPGQGIRFTILGTRVVGVSV